MEALANLTNWNNRGWVFPSESGHTRAGLWGCACPSVAVLSLLLSHYLKAPLDTFDTAVQWAARSAAVGYKDGGERPTAGVRITQSVRGSIG